MHKYIRPWRAECRVPRGVHSAQYKNSRALHQTVLACGSWAAGRQPASNKHLYMLPAPLPAPYTALPGATLLLPLSSNQARICESGASLEPEDGCAARCLCLQQLQVSLV